MTSKNPNFIPSSYIDTKGKHQQEYKITRDGFILLTVGYTGNEVYANKKAYINETMKRLDKMKIETDCHNNVIDITETLAEIKQVDFQFGLLAYLRFRDKLPKEEKYVLTKLGITKEEADNHPFIKDASPEMLPDPFEVLQNSQV